jgi:predicted HAD superfamily Cof-like phosphohydrolase
MSNITNFQKVGEFHKTFDHPILDSVDKDIFDKKALVDLRLKLISEEFQELKDAIKDKNIVEVADALSDILYVVYGTGHAFGIDLDKCFSDVHESNMTKACKTEEEAKESVAYLKSTKPEYKPDYKLSSDGKYYILYDKNNGKILKNKYYKPVDLTYIKN